MVEEGFFKQETITDLDNTLTGFKQDGYRFNVSRKIKLMSANSERFLGYADRMAFGITRQMAPIYVFGSPDPHSFTRGKRGIAGTMEIPAAELIQFYIDQPMRAIYEEVVGDETVQIIMDGVQMMSQGECITLEDIIHLERNEWTFIARTATVKRIPAHNRGYAKALLKKEWIPAWPDSAHLMEQI